jgi:hypothetical protein
MANGKVNTKIKDMDIECTDIKRKKLYDFLDKKLGLILLSKRYDTWMYNRKHRIQ